MSKALIEKWQPLLNIGAPVINEERASKVLEAISNQYKLDPNVGNIIIPSVRILLSGVDVCDYDQTLQTEDPIVMYLSTELVEDLEAVGVDINPEVVSVLSEDIKQCVQAKLRNGAKGIINVEIINNGRYEYTCHVE